MTVQPTANQAAPEKTAPAPQQKWKIENPTPRTVVVERVQVKEPSSPASVVKNELHRIPASVRSSVG